MRGASKGEGLGNKFLSHIREVDAVAYVLRCFEDDDVTHVENRIDPLADAEVVETELMLADMESLEKRAAAIEKKAKAGDKEAKAQFAVMEKALVPLREGKPARMADVTPEEKPIFQALQLLTSKPVVYVCNVEEVRGRQRQRLSRRRSRSAPRPKAPSCVIISAKIEAEFAGLPPADRTRIPGRDGADEPGLNRLIRAGYQLLDLVTYFTVGPERGPRLDDHARHQGSGGGRRHPHRLREGLHSRRDDRLRGLRGARRRGRRQGCRQDAARGQGVRRQGRRRDALPLRELTSC